MRLDRHQFCVAVTIFFQKYAVSFRPPLGNAAADGFSLRFGDQNLQCSFIILKCILASGFKQNI